MHLEGRFRLCTGIVTAGYQLFWGPLLPGNAVNELSQRLAQGKQIPKVLRGEIQSGGRRCQALAADLNHADDSAIKENRRADDLLDWFRGLSAQFYVLEDDGVTRSAEVIVDFRAAFAHGLSRERGVAGERNETNALERLWHEKMQVLPPCGNCQDGDLLAANPNDLRDFSCNCRERRLPCAGVIPIESAGNAF